MPVQVVFELTGAKGASEQLEHAIKEAIQSIDIPLVPSRDTLTAWQWGKSQLSSCFFSHWCGPTQNILAQYEAYRNPPRKATCSFFLSMKGKASPQSSIQDYVEDDVNLLKEQAQELTLQVRDYFRNIKDAKVEVRAISFESRSGASTGLAGKFETKRSIIGRVLNQFLIAGLPILIATFTVAGINNWQFLGDPTINLTATAIGYFILFIILCIINMRKYKGRIRFYAI